MDDDFLPVTGPTNDDLPPALHATILADHRIPSRISGAVAGRAEGRMRWRDGGTVLAGGGRALHEASTHFRRARG